MPLRPMRHSRGVEYLTTDEVLTIRRRIARQMEGSDFGFLEPLKPDALESAVARQTAGFGGVLKYKRSRDVAATLFYGIAMNHAFENGNKRTALVSLLVVLNRNRMLVVNTSEEDLYDFATSVAAHEIALPANASRSADSEVAAIAAWLAKRTRTLERGDTHVQFSALRKQLEAQGCEFDAPSKNFIKVHRQTTDGKRSHRMGYPRADFNVGVKDIKILRQRLALDEPHGVDSGAFYGELEAVVDGFVNEHRRVLDWLAET